MKSKITLNFFYVVMNVDGMEKKYTLVSSNPDYFKEQKKDSSSFIPVSFTLYRQEKHIIDSKKDPQLFDLAHHYFSTQSVLRYDNFISFDDNIDNCSFKKDFLLKNKCYEPDNEFEEFLSQQHILYSYYLKEVTFVIESLLTEYSRSYGSRDFKHQYETDRINMSIVTGDNENHRSTHLYSSHSTQKLVSFYGKNDLGQIIRIKHHIPSPSKKMSFDD